MIQSIKFHLPESNENIPPATNYTSDKSILSVSLNLSEESLNREEEQNISIRVLDQKSKHIVPYAKIRMELFYPSGRFEKLIYNNSDENGNLIYTWTAPVDWETDEYTLTLRT